jgi:hypothetical protein
MSNLKPFNLEKALAGEKVVTRSGWEVVAIFCDKVLMSRESFDDFKPVIFICKTPDQEKHYSMIATVEGVTENKMYDLFLLPKVTTYWANVYSNGRSIYLNLPHKSKDEALKCKDDGYIKTISFDIEEPEIYAGQSGTFEPLAPYPSHKKYKEE